MGTRARGLLAVILREGGPFHVRPRDAVSMQGHRAARPRWYRSGLVLGGGAMKRLTYGHLEAAAFLAGLALIGGGVGILRQLCRG